MEFPDIVVKGGPVWNKQCTVYKIFSNEDEAVILLSLALYNQNQIIHKHVAIIFHLCVLINHTSGCD